MLKFERLNKKVLEKLPVVTTSKIVHKNKYHPEGIFSEQIFGPLEDYKCWCDTPGATPGNRCPQCNILIAPRSLRKKIYARIDLPVEIISPEAVILIKNSPMLNKYYNMFVETMQYGLIDTFDKIEIVSIKDVDTDDGILVGLKAMERIILMLEDRANATIKKLASIIREGEFYQKHIIVIPPDYRPHANNQYSDKINQYYQTILYLVEHKLDTLPEEIFATQIQKAADNIVMYMIERLSKKEGLLRQKFAGKRLDFSARSVIIPGDRDIKVNEVGIPYVILLKLYSVEIAKILSKEMDITYKDAFQYIEELFLKREVPDNIKEIIENVTKNKYILINRQPTLHRGSILSFRIKPVDDLAIRLNPLVVEPLNADFDGDQIAVYHIENQTEAKRLSDLMYYNPADSEIYFLPKQDIIYSIYKITETEDGRKFLSEYLGIDDIKEQLDKKKIIKLIKTSDDITILDKIRDIAYDYTMENPITMNLYDYIQGQVDVELTGNVEEDIKKLNEAKEIVAEKFPKADIVKSGARASFTQISQMVAARGYVSDFFGKLHGPIKQSYLKGLDQKSFMLSNYGTRKGVLDTALNVSETGYLTRRLVYLASTCMLSEDINDCGTEKTLKLYIPDEDMAKRLMYRYIVDENGNLKKITNAKEIVGKTINLRTPIYCKSKRVCKTCYGDLHTIHQSRHIGIIAAQTVGERSTQLTLRTFHTGGVAESKSGKKQEDIVSGFKEVSAIFDSTIELNSANEVVNYLLKLYNIFKEYSSMHLVHLEVLLAEQMFIKLETEDEENSQYIRYRTNQDKNGPIYLLSSKVIPGITSILLSLLYERTKSSLSKIIMNPEVTKTDSPLSNIIFQIDFALPEKFD